MKASKPEPRVELERWSRPPRGICTVALLTVLLPVLAACGGSTDDSVAAPASRLHASAIRPLLADDGSVLAADPGSAPLDHGAHTKTGLYAQREQALQLERQLRGDVVWVPVECCGADAADFAVYVAYGMQAAHNLPASAPIFVFGADLRLAARVVNRLADDGMSRVFLVTPPRVVARPELR